MRASEQLQQQEGRGRPGCHRRRDVAWGRLAAWHGQKKTAEFLRKLHIPAMLSFLLHVPSGVGLILRMAWKSGIGEVTLHEDV